MQYDIYGDNGNGLMLGLPTRSLQRSIVAFGKDERTTRPASLVRVIYTDEHKFRLIKQLIAMFGPLFSDMFKKNMFRGNLRKLAMVEFSGQLYQLVSSFKEFKWHKEEEVRLAVTLLSNEAKPEVGKAGLRRPFERIRGTQNIPYLKAFPARYIPPSPRADNAVFVKEFRGLIVPLCVNEIIVGPDVDVTLAAEDMKQFLLNSAHSRVSIQPSARARSRENVGKRRAS